MTMGTRIAVMKEGKIQQVSSPQEVFKRPANMFVAGFIGSPSMNFCLHAYAAVPENLSCRFWEAI